jgi:hypothetical protein
LFLKLSHFLFKIRICISFALPLLWKLICDYINKCCMIYYVMKMNKTTQKYIKGDILRYSTNMVFIYLQSKTWLFNALIALYMYKLFEPRHDKTNIMCLLTNPFTSRETDSKQRVSDQTVWMCRLVWIHDGSKRTMLVLSWPGSFMFTLYSYLIWTCFYSLVAQKLFGITWIQTLLRSLWCIISLSRVRS